MLGATCSQRRLGGACLDAHAAGQTDLARCPCCHGSSLAARQQQTVRHRFLTVIFFSGKPVMPTGVDVYNNEKVSSSITIEVSAAIWEAV